MPLATVICAGMCTIDRTSLIDRIPPLPAKVRARAYTEGGGGMAATAAVAVARLGGTAQFLGHVGSDRAGEDIIDGLRKEGVDVSCVRRIEGARSVTSTVIVDAMGERLIIPDVDPRLEATPPRLPLGNVAEAGAVMCDGRWLAANRQLFAEARLRGVPTVLDIEPSPPEVYASLLPLTDHAVFSKPGLADFTGTEEVEAGLAIAFDRLECGVIGVTLGAEGATFLTSAGMRSFPAPAVTAVDTTGAGDAFHGAYALSVAEKRPLDVAVRFANAAAALKCTRLGSRTGLPTRAEVEGVTPPSGASRSG
jgi:sulfofructose kinase